MATYVLIHGAGDVGWYWHLVEAELRARGHDTVASDLPCEDDAAGLPEYASAVVDAIGERRHLVVVGQSLGGFTAPLVCDQVAADLLVVLAPMIPAPEDSPASYWSSTGYDDEVRVQHEDPIELFYQDVPHELAVEALRNGRSQSEARMGERWPLDAWPTVATRRAQRLASGRRSAGDHDDAHAVARTATAISVPVPVDGAGERART